MNEIKTVFLPERQRFGLDDAGKAIGAAHYRDFDGAQGTERIFFHTTVDEAYSGQGLASMLVKFALENSIAHGATIVPVCPYVKGYLTKHPEYAEHIVEPNKQHLAVLPRG